MDVSSHEDLAGEFYCAGSIFFNEAVRIYEQGSKALVTIYVGGSVQEYIALNLFRIDLLRLVNTEKATGNIFLH